MNRALLLSSCRDRLQKRTQEKIINRHTFMHLNKKTKQEQNASYSSTFVKGLQRNLKKKPASLTRTIQIQSRISA